MRDWPRLVQPGIRNPKPETPRTLILALGNPILSDDDVAWEIADRLTAHLPGDSFDFLKESGASFDWVLHEGMNHLRVRARNTAGVVGPESLAAVVMVR